MSIGNVVLPNADIRRENPKDALEEFRNKEEFSEAGDDVRSVECLGLGGTLSKSDCKVDELRRNEGSRSNCSEEARSISLLC